MLWLRIKTGLLAGTLFAGVVLLGGYWFGFLLLAICTVGFWELLTMRKLSAMMFPSLAGWAVLLASFFGGTNLVLKPIWFMTMLFVFLVLPVLNKNRTTFADSSYIWFGAFWLGLSFHDLMMLRLSPVQGFYIFAFVVLCMWATDIGAFFIGRSLKGPKIWPAISPNKTLSGSIGGVVLAAVIGLTFTRWGAPVLRVSSSISPYLFWAIVAGVLSVAGQVGDFAESALKRSSDVKDSGRILPGHGGILDRFDSLLLAGPLAYLIFSYFFNL